MLRCGPDVTPSTRASQKDEMPTYKLYYFNAKGRAESIRFVFAQAGVTYEDVRLTQEQWAEFKPKTPYGQMPVLEVDGKMLAGSGPIERFLAEQYELAGSNPFENADIASILDVLDDIGYRLMRWFYEKDEARKAELKKELEETHIPKYFGALEKRAAANNSADGWIYGAKVTYADFGVYLMSGHVQWVVPNVMDNYPALKKLGESVEKLPNIAKWLKERPETEN